MTPEAKAKYDAKLKRIRDAIALREPDTVPLTPSPAIFPYLYAGYTMAEVIYDDTLEKARSSMLKFLQDFDPDNCTALSYFAGQGKLLELSQPTTMRWAGMPGKPIADDSIHQYIEFPFLLDEEFDEFFRDRTGWGMRRKLPRSSDLLKPLEHFDPDASADSLAAELSKPEVKEMIRKLWELNDGNMRYRQRAEAVSREIEEMGYPIIQCHLRAAVPFDHYSDFLRGTLLSLADLYEHPDEVRRYIDENLEQTLAHIRTYRGKFDGKLLFMALHKGMDGFMSDEHYRAFYWDHLQKIICAIIDAGMVPYIYTEGKYDSRLDCLREVPAGKVLYHFEEVDMAEAKRKLGGTACISGGFPPYLLNYGTKEQVVDETKRLIDECAPGGGFIFETAYGIDYAKVENVEAMFDTVRTYGKKR
jgi:hypothetical protein